MQKLHQCRVVCYIVFYNLGLPRRRVIKLIGTKKSQHQILIDKFLKDNFSFSVIRYENEQCQYLFFPGNWIFYLIIMIKKTDTKVTLTIFKLVSNAISGETSCNKKVISGQR